MAYRRFCLLIVPAPLTGQATLHARVCLQGSWLSLTDTICSRGLDARPGELQKLSCFSVPKD
jgi:hypothetical protein